MAESGAESARRAQRSLWTCPNCGKQYVTRNMWHSCVVVPLESHFVSRPASSDELRWILRRKLYCGRFDARLLKLRRDLHGGCAAGFV